VSDERSAGPTPPRPPTNDELARLLREIGELLEVKGELVFKTAAYHRAADAVAASPLDVAAAYLAGTPPRLAGVGEAISRKLDELARTGRLDFLDRLRAEVPPSLLELLELPGVGPKTVRLLHETLGISTLEELRRAAEAGTLRTLRGMSERTEASILDGIRRLAASRGRLLLGRAEAIVADLVAALGTVPGVVSVVPAGSFRRRRESIGDLDLLAETSDPAALVTRFTTLPGVEAVLGAGSHKAAVRLKDGPQVDLMVMPPGEAGTYLIHFTGSKEHNVRLRGRARDRGWSLSEKGFLRLGPDGEPAAGPDGAPPELRTFPTEAAAYAFLDLPWIEPELREDRGEVEAAVAGRLPRLVEPGDLRGDLHVHTDASDGLDPLERVAEAARARGHAYAAITDHSVSLAVARGLDAGRVAAQRAAIDALNERYAAEAAAGAPPFRLLHGCELEIRADGSLDHPDELLAAFDIVVASLHVARTQPRERLTDRVLGAIASPHVDVIAHPAGRMIGTRDELDLDWEAVFLAAARTGTVLEVNGSDARLDLADQRARRAVELGCTLSIASDAHRVAELDALRWGVAQARRGWVGPGSVLNARPLDELLAWLAAKPARVAVVAGRGAGAAGGRAAAAPPTREAGA
jgi:DNA polymerase (family 10)